MLSGDHFDNVTILQRCQEIVIDEPKQHLTLMLLKMATVFLNPWKRNVFYKNESTSKRNYVIFNPNDSNLPPCFPDSDSNHITSVFFFTIKPKIYLLFSSDIYYDETFSVHVP